MLDRDKRGNRNLVVIEVDGVLSRTTRERHSTIDGDVEPQVAAICRRHVLTSDA